MPQVTVRVDELDDTHRQHIIIVALPDANPGGGTELPPGLQLPVTAIGSPSVSGPAEPPPPTGSHTSDAMVVLALPCNMSRSSDSNVDAGVELQASCGGTRRI